MAGCSLVARAKFPDEWGRKVRIDHRTPDAQVINQNHFIFIEEKAGRGIEGRRFVDHQGRQHPAAGHGSPTEISRRKCERRGLARSLESDRINLLDEIEGSSAAAWRMR